MDVKQANKQAIKRYGSKAVLEVREDGWLRIFLNDPPATWDVKKYGSILTLLGWGRTWEAAFAMADICFKWMKKARSKA